MNTEILTPNEQIASSVVHAMTGEQILVVTRMATGDQNFVYALKTPSEEYVLRMTDAGHKYKFHAAVAWQNMLLPLGIPLAEFIKSDLAARYSPFPALLMKRLPGDDLINVYPYLTEANKKNLATEMTGIQDLCAQLPEGPGYGILDSYDTVSGETSWYGFLSKRLELYKEHITKNAVFDPRLATLALDMAKDMEDSFRMIKARPFLWDASERNVLVHDGRIAGIVDVDEICFGDPLLVIALTSTCLELEGFDTLYTEYWASALNLDQSAQARLDFYKLFYAVAFMRKHSMQTTNSKKVMFDTGTLQRIFHDSLDRLNK